MTDSLNRKAVRFLALAVTIAVVIGFPMEQVIREQAYWPQLCARGEMLLNLGSVIQALLVPFAIFLLPGLGSIFPKKLNSLPPSRPSLVGTACLCGAAIPLIWWFSLRQNTGTQGICSELFDLSRPSDPFHRDYVKDSALYFIYLSAFTALWAGIAACGLRLQSARVSARTDLTAESLDFLNFRWVCMLGWAVQYRLSEWVGLLWARQQQEWSFLGLLNFAFLTVGSLWSLTIARSLWNTSPRTRRNAIMRAYWRTFLIYLLTTMLLIWSPLIAAGPLSYPIVTLNLFGLAWAVLVGTWQWRSVTRRLA